MQATSGGTSGLNMQDLPSARPSTAEPTRPRVDDARAAAAGALAVWRDVDSALSPIIGKRGVAALFRRSLYLTQAAHPWLAQDATEPEPFQALHSALTGQTAAVALAAHDALLRHFRTLLGRLIGVSLTDRLLQPVLDLPSGGGAAQDLSP